MDNTDNKKVVHKDEIRKCLQCGKEFVFTGGEKAFYLEKGLTRKPNRCPDCRKKGKKHDPRFDGLRQITNQMDVRSSNYFKHTEEYGPSINVNGGLLNSPGYRQVGEKNGDLIFEGKVGNKTILRKHGKDGKWDK